MQGIIDILEDKADRKELDSLAMQLESTRRTQVFVRREEVEQLVENRVQVVGEMRVELNKVHNAFYDWQLQNKKTQVSQVTKEEVD